MTSNEPFRDKRSKLKSGGLSDNPSCGKLFMKKMFQTHKMAEFIEIKKEVLKVQNECSQTIEDYTEKSNSTQ